MGEENTERAEARGDTELDVDARIDDANAAGEASPDGVDVDQLEQERAERLDPDNRPDGAEVDNTGRDFDPEVGLFTDSDGYDEAKAQVEEASDAEAESAADDEVVDTEAAAETGGDEAE